MGSRVIAVESTGETGRRAHCRRCRHNQWFVRHEMNHSAHLLLSVCTCGLWSVAWLSAALGARFRPWRCQHCSWTLPPALVEDRKAE